jgi:signal transduction histidine kinase/DNA-binding response OmpR family regulator
MSVDLVLTIALDVAFFGVLAFTVLEYLRRRERIQLLVVLVFASLGIVLASTPIRAVLPVLAPILSLLTIPALLSQPVLVLWLASLMRPTSRILLWGAVAAFVLLNVTVLWLMATRLGGSGGTVARNPITSWLLLALLAYFVVLEGGAAVSLGLAARARAGASRARLAVAAVATELFGAALVMVLGAGLVSAPNSPGAEATSLLGRLVALLSAVGYLVAFAPPRRLRRLTQQAIVYDFIRELTALPSGAPVEQIWHLLRTTVMHASGASRVEVVEGGATAVTSQQGGRMVAVPFDSTRWPGAHLELDLPAHALFRDDDLELTGLLVDRAVRAAEREAFLVEREAMIADLQAASAAKSDFLAAMSHELRTPLNAIIGFSELLTEDGDDADDPETVVTYAEHIHGSGLHLLGLVNDVLDLARVEAGRLDLKPVDVELDALIRQTVATVRPLADGKHLAVELQLAPVTIAADPARVRQIVLNLLSNAIKFTADGGEIRLSLEADERGAAHLRVSDTGHGIAAGDLDRIFEAFQQAPGEGLQSHEGTGLGLALTRQLVEAHGGTVGVTSALGVGSEFTVVLPARGRRTSDDGARPPEMASGRPSVLVVEDDPAAQELLRRHLEGAGYEVLTTASGKQGLAWMAEVRPDAVILDILLPDLDGWEILQHAKSDERTRSIPIMVVSVVDDRELGLALGAVDYFVKPVSRERLLEALGRLTFTTKVRTRTVTALVIDSDPEAAARYRELLEPDGFRVIDAASGADGHHRAATEQPDLILLDAMLPDVDGFELANALKHDPATATIPIWLTTPTGLEPEAKLRLNGTVQGVLERGDEALAAMRQWLETPRRAPAPGEVPA